MTISKLSAGDGYSYYVSEVATSDVRREPGQELGDYYLAHGNPPGQWVGGGLDALGVRGEVTETQMRALFGEGLHPDAEQRIEAALAEGVAPRRAVRESQLGRPYYRYQQRDDPLATLTAERISAFEAANGRTPSAGERRELRVAAAREAFTSAHGRDPADEGELRRFVRAASKPAPQAVAGYDLQFAPPKSVSTLWALGDDAVRRQVEQAHEAAIAGALSYIEDNAVATRTGAGGVAQIDVDGGLVATRFRHYDSRAGDPQLHDHVVVSNKVRGSDGQWRSLDGALLYRMGVAASERYNEQVVNEVAERLGVAVEQRVVRAGRRPVFEIAGVDRRLTEAWSSRSQQARLRTEQLVDEYRAAHGKDPDERVRIGIAQQATLDTRPAKKQARSLADLRAQWRQDAVARVGEGTVDRVLQTAQRAAQGRPTGPVVDVGAAAAQVVDTVEQSRSVWGRHHLEAEARRWVTGHHAGRPPAVGLVDAITTAAVERNSVQVTPADFQPAFDPLTRADGSSVYTHRQTALFTSRAVLAAEDRVLTAARTSVIPAVSAEMFDAIAATGGTRQLDAGQLELARAFATSDRLVVAGIGPAGAGKTTALDLVRKAVEAQSGRVVALGPSARAAAVLRGELGVEAHTLDSWLIQREQARRSPGRARRGFDLSAGDVVVVDEAGMAGTRKLAAVVDEAERAGAHVRLIGDPAQLASVESGGALRLVAHEVGAVELESVWRFHDRAEAAASLAVRDGASGSFDWYLDHGRVVGGSRQVMTDEVFAAWQHDTEEGKRSLMMAPDANTVDALNRRAQAYAIAAGRVDTGRLVGVSGDDHVGVGDLVVTRANDRRNTVHSGRDWVKNGDTWTVTGIGQDGALSVRGTSHGGTAVLAPDYVRGHVELGYASTVHRSQGVTVDSAHVLVSAATTREAAYVGITRGRSDNRLYAVTAAGESHRDVLARVLANSRPSVTAHEAIRAEQSRVAGVEALVRVYADVTARADDLRFQRVVRNVLPTTGDRVTAGPGWPAVVAALRAGERAGWEAERLVGAAASRSGRREPAGLSAAAVRRAVRDGAALADRGGGLSALSADSLGNLRRAAERRLNGAVADRSRLIPAGPAVEHRIGARSVPGWTERPLGGLSAKQLHELRTALREQASGAGDRRAVAGQLRAVLVEQRVRQALNPVQYARESAQRSAAASNGDASRRPYDAEQLAAAEKAVQAAQRVLAKVARAQTAQRRSPDRPAGPVPGPDRLPGWLVDPGAVQDANTPAAWREHLAERRAQIVDGLRAAGLEVAATPPAWAAGLGSTPAAGPARERWLEVAGAVALYRRARGVPDTETSPVPGRKPEGTQLRHQIAQLRTDVVDRPPTEGGRMADRITELRAQIRVRTETRAPSTDQRERDDREPRREAARGRER